MTDMNNKIHIEDMDLNRSYEGYLWLSKDTKPEIIEGPAAEKWPSGCNPFVVEGWLLDKDAMVSYYIKMVDGQYLVYPNSLTEEDIKVSKDYEGNRFDGKMLRFCQKWNRKIDELCEGMEVLEPGALVFTGFKK